MQELSGNTFLLLARDLKTWAALLKVLVRAMKHLAAIRLAFADNGRDFSIVVIEDLAQQEDGAFHRPQILQHHQEGEGKRLSQDGRLGQILTLTCRDRLRQPGANVEFALCPGRAQLVDTEACHYSGKKGFGRLDIFVT